MSKYKVSCGRKPVSQLLYRQHRRILLQLGIRKIQSEKRRSNQSSSSLHDYFDSNLTVTHNSVAEDSLPPRSFNASHSVSRDSRHKISELADANLVLQSLVSSVCNSESQPPASSDSSVTHKEETDGFFSDDEESRHSFSQLLHQCFIDTNIPHTTGNNILKILRTHSCFSSLPKDSRTLLKTPRIQIELSIVEPGEYVHFGFKKGVIKSLKKIPSTLIPNVLEIDFNTDGGALDKSGNSQIWPLQIRIVNIRNTKPEVVGIYRGPGKPTNACDFFKMFVNEVIEIIRDGGINYKGTKLSLRLRAFIADAPARVFILNHKGHVAFHPCSKCLGTSGRSESSASYLAVQSAGWISRVPS